MRCSPGFPPFARAQVQKISDVILLRALYASIAFTPLIVLQPRLLGANVKAGVSLQSLALVCHVLCRLFNYCS